MKGWMLSVSGPDLATNQSAQRRLVVVAAHDSDEAFEGARAAVPGGLPQLVGPLTEDTIAALGVTPGKGKVLSTF